MAKMLFKQGGFKILADDITRLSSVEINELIRTAGATCYQTRETIKKTPEEFIKMLYSLGHISVLEHSWFCFSIHPAMDTKAELAKIGYQLYRANNLFSITENREKRLLIISGNARMFNEAYARISEYPILRNIFMELHGNNPALFPNTTGNDFLFFGGEIEANPELKSREEIMNHTAMCVEFNQHCRGFTHEHVRHRIASFSQESTRYVDYAKGDVNLDEFQVQFILPYNDKFDFSKKIEFICGGETYLMSPVDFTNMIEAFYRSVRKAGLKPEEARQWLPIGLKSQIVTTANLKEWRHWFYMRTSEFAHPEIRWSAVNLLKFCKERWSDIFDDFNFGKAKDGSECAVFVGSKTP